MKNSVTKDSKIVIVGGGLAGLFAARTLLYFGYTDITLIEKEQAVGGLMQSYTMKVSEDISLEPVAFDYGTHFVLTTGSPAIDDILLQDIDDDFVAIKGSMPQGHVLNNIYYEHSGCAAIANLPESDKGKILQELESLQAQGSTIHSSNIRELYVSKYGLAATEKIYRPAFNKFTGQDIENLDICMEEFFSSPRLVIADREHSKKLKQTLFWDERVAYAHAEDAHSSMIKYYPKKGGIGAWMNKIAAAIQKKNVKCLTGKVVTKISYENGYVTALHIEEEPNPIVCDHLIFTLPAALLGFQTGVKIPSLKPIMRHVSVFQLIVDQKPTSAPYWITVYDEDSPIFRITQYENFVMQDTKKGYRLSVEMLHNAENAVNESDLERVISDLKKFGVLQQSCKILASALTRKKDGFPIISPAMPSIFAEQIATLENALANISICGRRLDYGQGQIAVMKSVYDSIKTMSGTPKKTIVV